MQNITPFLWFDGHAEEAAHFYTSIFPNSKISGVTHYSEVGPGPTGSVMTVSFELNGEAFVALNGGPIYKFTPAVSFVVHCETQEELDTYWDKLPPEVHRTFVADCRTNTDCPGRSCPMPCCG